MRKNPEEFGGSTTLGRRKSDSNIFVFRFFDFVLFSFRYSSFDLRLKCLLIIGELLKHFEGSANIFVSEPFEPL